MAAILGSPNTASRFQAHLDLSILNEIAAVVELLGEERSRREAGRLRVMRDYLEVLRDHCSRPAYVALQDRLPRRIVDIYIAQQQKEQAPWTEQERAGQQAAARPPETADEALARHRHLLIEGRAGLGKSTLLGHLAFERLQGPLQDARREPLPILVRAPDLAAHLGVGFSATLARAATAQLGGVAPGTTRELLRRATVPQRRVAGVDRRAGRGRGSRRSPEAA